MKKLNGKGLMMAWLGTVMTLIIISCEKGPNFREFTYPAPIVNDFHPKQGYVGSLITIDGADFGTLKNAVKVYFGDVPADSVNHVEDNKIEVLVPENAVSGMLTVEIFGKQDQTKEELTLLPSAKVVLVSTDKAQEGEEVTITGENFGENSELVQVFIGEVEAEVISVTPTEVSFTVPDAPSGNIILIVDGQRLTASYLMIGLERLMGTLIGHSGSWGNNAATMITAAVDGDITTYADAPSGVQGYIGYDLGVGKSAILSSVRVVPRAPGNSTPGQQYQNRMIGGEIRGTNNPNITNNNAVNTVTDYEVLYKIEAAPTPGVYTELSIEAHEQPYRYIYYTNPDEASANIAEIEFYGNIVDYIPPVGKYVWEFNADNEGWVPQQSAAHTVSDGAINVTFPQTTGNKRSDLRYTNTPITVHPGTYPIFAMKITGAKQARVTFDVNGAQFGNAFNQYKTDFEDQEVWYWDMSTLGLAAGATPRTEEMSFTTFQFKIADMPQEIDGNPTSAGYTVEWIRTFESKEELSSFLGL